MSTLQERLRNYDEERVYARLGADVVMHEAADRLDDLEREVEALRNDFAALQHAIVGDTGASAILTVEALRADAERYRLLRSQAYEAVIPHGGTLSGKRTAWITKMYAGDSFDAAIDAARSKT